MKKKHIIAACFAFMVFFSVLFITSYAETVKISHYSDTGSNAQTYSFHTFPAIIHVSVSGGLIDRLIYTHNDVSHTIWATSFDLFIDSADGVGTYTFIAESTDGTRCVTSFDVVKESNTPGATIRYRTVMVHVTSVTNETGDYVIQKNHIDAIFNISQQISNTGSTFYLDNQEIMKINDLIKICDGKEYYLNGSYIVEVYSSDSPNVTIARFDCGIENEFDELCRRWQWQENTIKDFISRKESTISFTAPPPKRITVRWVNTALNEELHKVNLSVPINDETKTFTFKHNDFPFFGYEHTGMLELVSDNEKKYYTQDRITVNINYMSSENTIVTFLMQKENVVSPSPTLSPTEIPDDIRTGLSIEGNEIPDHSLFYAGDEVIVSFYLYSKSTDILPSDNVSVLFFSYINKGSSRESILSETVYNIVVPKGEKNIIYFKFRLPENSDGNRVICTAMLNCGEFIDKAVVAKDIYDRKHISTDIHSVDFRKPSVYSPSAEDPYDYTPSLQWYEWTYDGSFIKNNYSISISSANHPIIIPDTTLSSPFYSNGAWYMRSGYGFTYNYTPSIKSNEGFSVASINMYTLPQGATVLFPEYGYKSSEEYTERPTFSAGNYFEFSGQDNLHFVPLWVKDGEYKVLTSFSSCWTPVGELVADIWSLPVIISGSMYDDSYIGR